MRKHTLNPHQLRKTVGISMMVIMVIFAGCYKGKKKIEESGKQSKEIASNFTHPEWSKNATMYEVNIRQYTEEGTFDAFQEHLPRLKELGVDILWLMPIHPIGEKNRKGPLGSYYSVKDYKGINPNFGTKEDFQELVDKIHEMDMKIIIDWVANHSAWDNPLIEKHPEWYSKDSAGNFHPPVEDWTDVVDFNYENENLRDYMRGAMEYWVRDFNIDGYRCDVAAEVPTDFWNNTRKALDEIKPVFMLAEANKPELHEEAFDMTYAWDLHFIMNEVAEGKKNANDIAQNIERDKTKYPKNAYRLIFTSNHDENSWKGSTYERLGEGVETFAMLTYTLPGMPLIYNGQEACLDRKLKFFEKDLIEWKDCNMTTRYKQLNHLKKENEALWNGQYGGSFERMKTNDDENVLAFVRASEDNQLFVIANLSKQPVDVTLEQMNHKGTYINYFEENKRRIKKNKKFSLDEWGYKVFIKK